MLVEKKNNVDPDFTRQRLRQEHFVSRPSTTGRQMKQEKQNTQDTLNATMGVKDEQICNTESDDVEAVVVGTLAVDLTCNLQGQGEKQLLFTSTPGNVETSVGGVGHNVALASQYHGTKTRLVTELGEDDGASIAKQLMKLKDTNGISINPEKRTPRYIAMHDSTGELFAACADMEDGGKMNLELIHKQIEKAKPKVVFFDGNIETPQKEAVIQAAKKVGALVGFEPASVIKAKRLAQVPHLGVYPNQSVDIITPNRYELGALFEAYRDAGYFDVDLWFPIIDELNLGQSFRTMMERFSQSDAALKSLSSDGIVQQAIHLLPYIPTIVVKDGKNGVVCFQLVDSKTTQPPSNHSTRLWQGRGKHDILIQHFPAQKIDTSKIVSVTGAGDTFCGVLMAELAKDHSWLQTLNPQKDKVINMAQMSASRAIQSKDAVAAPIE